MKTPMYALRLSFVLFISFLFAQVRAESASTRNNLEDKDIIEKMKSALSPLFKENEDYQFSEINVGKEAEGFKVSGNAIFYKMTNVLFVGTLSTADKMARFELNFPAGSLLSEEAQQKIAKQVFLNWIPADLKALVNLKSMYMDFADNSISTIGIRFASNQSWKPLNGINANNIYVDFNINSPLGGVSISSTLAGKLNIGKVDMELSAILSSKPENIVLNAEVKNLAVGEVLGTFGIQKAAEWPDALWNLSMSNGRISIAPYGRTMSLFTTSDFGQVEFAIDASGPVTDLILGIAPPADFSFAKFDASLGILDNIGLKNTAIVLASSTKKTKLNIFSRLGQETEVTKGLTLLALYDVSATSKELEKLMGKSQLLLRTTISTNPAELKLMASLDASIILDEKSNVILKNVNFTIVPNAANFTISLGGSMDLKTEKKTLNFTANLGVDLTNLELKLEGIMNGIWDRPFETEGVQLANLGIGVGISFKTSPIPMPTLSFKGMIKVGNPASPAFSGDVTFAMDPSNPTQCMIDAGFKQILFKDLVAATAPKAKIPDDMKNTINAIALTDARLTIVPGITTVQVLGNNYEPGFLVKGKSTINDYYTDLLVGISKGGVRAKAAMSEINYTPYFTFTGALGKPDPYLDLTLSTTDPKSSRMAISGKATALKLIAEADMMISDYGFSLFMKGKIFDLFQSKLTISAGGTKDGAAFNVKAIMDSDLQQFINDIASAEIDRATKASQKSFKEAQQTLTAKQKEVAELNIAINKQRAIVQSQRDKDCAKFEDAKAQVKKDRKKVNNLKDDVDDIKDKIKKLEKQIDKDWTTGPENGAKITKLKAEQIGLETAIATAKGVLKGSEKILEAMGEGCEATPIELDPRVASLIAARETADKSLEAAKAIVKGTGFITGGSLKATKYIVEKGTTGVVTVTYAMFDMKLNEAHGGMIKMKVKGTFADETLDQTFILNMNDAKASVEAFARDLLK